METTIAGKRQATASARAVTVVIAILPVLLLGQMLAISRMAGRVNVSVGPLWVLGAGLLGLEGLTVYALLKAGRFEYRLNDVGIAASPTSRIAWDQVAVMFVTPPTANQPHAIVLTGSETGLGAFMMRIMPAGMPPEIALRLVEELRRHVRVEVTHPAFLVLASVIATAARPQPSLPVRVQKDLRVLNLSALLNALKARRSPETALLLAQVAYLMGQPAEAASVAEPLLAAGDPDAILVSALAAVERDDEARSHTLFETLRDTRYGSLVRTLDAPRSPIQPAGGKPKVRNSMVVTVGIAVMALVYFALEVFRALTRV